VSKAFAVTDLSVVIVNWNTGDLLAQCLASLRHARPALSLELIVVDNASTDGSAHGLPQEGDGLRLIAHTSNLGFARACNRGIGESRGRYILLLNPDTRVLPGSLEAMLVFMDAHPEAGAAGPALLNPDGSLQPSGGRFPSLRGLLAIHPTIARLFPAPEDPLRRRDFSRVAEVEEVSGACLLIRRSAWEAVGPLDEAFFLYFEEVDWCLRVTRQGWKVYYVPQARVIHHWRSRTDPDPQAQLYHLRSQRSYVRKHFGRGPFLLLTAVCLVVHTCLLAMGLIRWLLRPKPSHRQDLRRSMQLLRVCLGG
jgi:GT2 family glycosyltransferase